MQRFFRTLLGLALLLAGLGLVFLALRGDGLGNGSGEPSTIQKIIRLVVGLGLAGVGGKVALSARNT